MGKKGQQGIIWYYRELWQKKMVKNIVLGALFGTNILPLCLNKSKYHCARKKSKRK